MIEVLPDMPDNVVAFRASGQVTGDDYETVLIPAVEEKLSQGGRIRLLYQLGPNLRKFTTTAFWDDAKVGFHHLGDFERIAVVTDMPWVRTMTKAIGLTMPGRIRTFTIGDFEAARVWIASEPTS
jgi:hypothetical protein